MQSSFTECPAHRGGHLQPELIIVEFLDDNNQPVAPGEPGEVTITTLGVTGMPLLPLQNGRHMLPPHRTLRVRTPYDAPQPCARTQGADDKV